MLLTALLSVLLGLAQQDAPETIDSRLERVTVFPQKAMVERVFEVSAERAGEKIVRLGPLPVAAERESVQVRVLEGEVEVQGIEAQVVTASGAADARTRALRADLEAARLALRDVRTELSGLEARQEVLNSLISSFGLKDRTPEEIDAFLQTIADRSMALDRERAEIQQREQVQADLVEELGRDLAARGSEARPVLMIDLPLRFEAPGTAQFRMLYMVRSASWEPSYELRVATDLTGVAMSQVARVTQTTGEDWDAVELFLSTSMPSRGLEAPELPRRIYQLPFSSAPDLDGLAGEAFRAGSATARAAGGSGAAAVVSQNGTGGVVALFQVSGSRSVRSVNEVARFELASLPLDVRPERYVVPSVSDQAWLRAEIRYNGPRELIPGRARVYLGGDLLGETQIPMLPSGGRTIVSLGPDPTIKVRVQTVLDERREPGILSSTARIVRGFQAEVRLEPSANGPVRVLVEERLPRSRDERVNVKATRLNPAPLDDDESKRLREQQGLVRWSFELAPGATRRINWGYEASFDEDLDPILIER